MATEAMVPVRVTSRNFHELPATPGEINQITYDKKDRTSNALKTFGTLIAFTFASIFIPILHFILVPTLFIASFVLAMDKSRETSRNLGGSAECPKCHAQFHIEKSKWDTRYTDTCEHCHDDLEIKTAFS